MAAEKTQAWSGGVWGNEFYPAGNPAQAPHVVLQRERAGAFSAHFALGNREGVPGATDIGEYRGLVWAPLSQLSNPDSEHGDAVGSWIEDPMHITIAKPERLRYQGPFLFRQRPMAAITRLARQFGFVWTYLAEDDPIGAGEAHLLMPGEGHINIPEPDGEQFELSYQHVLMGGLRAVMAHELDQRGML